MSDNLASADTVRGKILANLANGRPFAKIFPANIYKYDEIPEQNYYNNGGTAKVF